MTFKLSNPSIDSGIYTDIILVTEMGNISQEVLLTSLINGWVFSVPKRIV